MSKIPSPSVEEMLVIGHQCELKTVGEAYCQYMDNFIVFFIIDNQIEQVDEFVKDMQAFSLTRRVSEEPGERIQLDITEEYITDACNRLNIPLKPAQ